MKRTCRVMGSQVPLFIHWRISPLGETSSSDRQHPLPSLSVLSVVQVPGCMLATFVLSVLASAKYGETTMKRKHNTCCGMFRSSQASILDGRIDASVIWQYRFHSVSLNMLPFRL